MAVRKEPSGRWRAVVKSGRLYVGGRTFDTKSAAVAWEQRQRAALDGMSDARAGRQLVRDALGEWLDWRRGQVAESTYATDRSLSAVWPTSLLDRQIASVRTLDIERAIDVGGGTAGTRERRKITLSAFFSWCVREGLISASPVVGVRVSKSVAPPRTMNPWTWNELDEVASRMATRSPRCADVVLILGWTGLRWGEARSLRVGDVQRLGGQALIVRTSHTEGLREKTTKGGKVRRVPVADRVWPIVLGWCEGRDADDHLFVTERGAQLHKSNVRRAVRWAETARGHSIHDLRHTAATEWLRSGVDVRTVQAWLGHASMTTTQIYVHHLGTHADRAAIDLVNLRGTPGARDSSDMNEKSAKNAV